MAWRISSCLYHTALHRPVFGLHFTDLEKGSPSKIEEQEAVKTLTLKEIVKISVVKTMCCLFFTTCAIECTCGGWGSTFLVEYKHMAADRAAKMVMFYYIGMALGRFLSGILATRLNRWQIIKIGQYVLGGALILLLLPLSPIVSAIVFFLAGFGDGALFPNFNYLTPQNFGEDVSQSVMGTQMTASYVGIMLAPALCGLLGQFINMSIFPIYLLVFYMIMMIAIRTLKGVL